MTLHTAISYLKSALRIGGYVSLLHFFLVIGFCGPLVVLPCILLIIAEVLGIIEELPGAYKGTKVS